MVLIDTSVWIDFFANLQTPEVSKLESFIEKQENLCICGLIMTELLQGIREDREFQQTYDVLSQLIYLPMTTSTYIRSANIFRSLRKKGITIRKTIDCLIASLCMEHEVLLLHHDQDFKFISKHYALTIA